MNVTQVKDLVNQITCEIVGEEATLLNENLSNVVEVGDQIMASDVDNYVKKLVDRIGKTIYSVRKYEGDFPKIKMDGWEFGSVLQKISVEIEDADETADWQLVDGASYDTNVFHAPAVSVKYFNGKNTFTIRMSYTERQLRESFTDAEHLAGFISSIETSIYNSKTVKMSGLAHRTINNMIGLTMYDDFASTSSFSSASHTKAINLLYEYNNGPNSGGTALTAANCMYDKDFIRFASKRIGETAKRMGTMSRLFNIDKKARFTSADMLNVTLHADFLNSAKAYLYSDTFHEQYVSLPAADSVVAWQGTGHDFAPSETMSISCVTTDNKSMVMSGIIGVMFDREACAICNRSDRTYSHFVEEGEFTNYWYKFDCELITDPAENFVVFFVA